MVLAKEATKSWEMKKYQKLSMTSLELFLDQISVNKSHESVWLQRCKYMELFHGSVCSSLTATHSLCPAYFFMYHQTKH